MWIRYYVTIDSTVFDGQTADVTTMAEFIEAVANPDIGIISVQANLTAATINILRIDRPLLVQGNGYTLTFGNNGFSGCIVFFMVVLLGGLGAYIENKYKNERNEIEQKLLSLESSGSIGKVIDSFSDDLGFLSKSLNYQRVSSINQLLLKLNEQIHSFKKKYPREKLKTDQFEAISKQCNIIQQKLIVQNSVNEIFQSPLRLLMVQLFGKML